MRNRATGQAAGSKADAFKRTVRTLPGDVEIIQAEAAENLDRWRRTEIDSRIEAVLLV